MRSVTMMRALALTMVLALTVGSLQAQTSTLLYGSKRNPLTNQTNPAFYPSNNSFYMTLPGLNVDIKSPLSYGSVVTFNDSLQRTEINLNSILDTLKDDGRLRMGLNIHAVGMGFRVKNTFVTFSSGVKSNVGLGVPSGLAEFVNEGNTGHVGDDYMELLDGELLSAMLYGEYALGAGHKFSGLLGGDLSVGARAKLLLGYYNITTDGSSLRLYTAEDYSSITAQADLCITMASAVDFDAGFAMGNLLPNNRGVGFDFGLRYEWNRFDFSASVLDFGPGITWNDNVKQVVSPSTSFTFEGVDLNGFFTGDDSSSVFQAIVDSLRTIIDTSMREGQPYKTAIPTKLNLGAMVNIVPCLDAGVLFHGQWNRGLVKVDDVFKTKTTGFSSNTTVLVRLNVHDWLEVSACASVITNNGKTDWFNPGFGMTLTPGRAFQMYCMMDYTSSMYVIDCKNFNLILGVNLMIGNKERL